MTASTPPLVDVIAGVLREHEEVYWNHDTRDVRCICEHYFGKIPGTFDARLRAHQARAVLDALTKAGGVEVVTGYGVKLKSGDVERRGTNIQDAKDWLEDFTGGDDPDYEPVEVVTRTTTTITIRTYWTKVEG